MMVLILGGAILAGCGGSTTTTGITGPLPSGAYTGTFSSRLGERLELEIVNDGVNPLRGFARWKRGNLDYVRSQSVTGSASPSGTMNVNLPGVGNLILARQGSSQNYNATLGAQTGVIRLSQLAATTNVNGRWTGTWVDGGNNVMDLRFTQAGNLVQITGTSVNGTATGRVSTGLLSIVGDRFELRLELAYPLITRTLRAEGQIQNGNRIEVTSALILNKS